MAKRFVLPLVLIWMLALWLTIAPTSVAASLCRNLGDRSLCIVSIQRSAKHYWEYRAIVRIDGKESALEVYNCRDRIRVQSDGAIVPFEPNGAGQLVCRLYKK